MSAVDHQLGVIDEVTYGTAVTVSRFFEYNSETIEEDEGRTEGNPLRTGHHVNRNDRFTPYFRGAAGPVQMDVLTKGFGWWLKHLLGSVATSGAGPYVHTGTMGDLYGDSFTLQVNKPFHPSGTSQAFTYSGGKVASWTLSNTVDANLLLEVNCDFQTVSTAIALATASYPTSMDPLTWAGGVVTIGGTSVDIDEISVSVNNALNVDRRSIRGNTLKKEPTAGRRSVEWSISADFESLTQRNRAHASARADALAQIVGTWTFGTSSLVLTIDEARMDKWSAPTSGTDGIKQALSGVGLYDGTASPITLAYTTADTTP